MKDLGFRVVDPPIMRAKSETAMTTASAQAVRRVRRAIETRRETRPVGGSLNRT